MSFTDRSRVVDDWECGRSRYWGYEYDGTGLAPMQPNADFAFGLAMAEQTANLKLGKPWTVEGFAAEKQQVATALLLGYEHIVWPRWLTHYDLVGVEVESPLQLAPWLTYQARPDTIMRRKSDGTYWYGPEDKTTSNTHSLLNYANAIQLHATALAIEANQPYTIMGCIVQGLYKGFEKEGKLYHNLVWAYCKEGRIGIVPDQWSIKWVRGWERTLTERHEGGMLGWIKSLQPEALTEIFPNSEPVTVKRPLVKTYFDQVLIREAQIEAWRQAGAKTDEETLNTVFPQHFNMCDYRYGKPCIWKDACFTPTAKRFPLTFYKRREAHHTGEKEAMA